MRQVSLALLLILSAAMISSSPACATSVFTSDFESASFASEGWTVVTGSQTNRWWCGAATNNGGTHGGYVCEDTVAATNSYNTSAASVVHIYRDVTFPAGETYITLTFDWKGYGESTNDDMRVFLVPTSTTPAAGTELTSGQIGLSRYNLQPAYTTATIVIAPSNAGTTRRLVFSWRNDSALGTQPPAALDNVYMTTLPPLAGSYTIDNTQPTSGTNYASFTAAISALDSRGSSSDVTFSVLAGQIFTEDPPAIAPPATSGTITFERSGGGANPIVKPTGTAGDADFGLCISGADGVTIDGIDVSIQTGSAVEYGILVRNASATDGAQNCAVKNTKITLNRVNTSSIGILQTTAATGGGITPTAASGANSHNKYYNVTIENTYSGIYLLGTAAHPDLSTEVGVTGGGTSTIGAAAANDIGNGPASCWGIRATGQNSLSIFNLKVRNVTGTSTNTTAGIWLDNTAAGTYGTVQIFNNTVHNIARITSTSTAGNVYGIRADMATGNTARVYNNDVYGLSMSNPSSATSTIMLQAIAANVSGASTVDLYFNSVRIDHSTALNLSSAAFWCGGGAVNLQNDIFANVTGAQSGFRKHYAAYVGGGMVSTSSNNIYYAPNANGVLAFWGLVDRTLLEMFAANTSSSPPVDGQEGGSANANPNFAGATDLTFAGATPAAGSAVPIPGITTDITGAARGTPPDIGAHETANALSDASAPVLSNVMVSSGGAPTVSVTLSDNSAAGTPAPIQLWYRLGASGAFTGLAPDTNPGVMNGTYTWSTSLSGLATGTYQFFIAARDGRGAGQGLWANPMWTMSFPQTGGWSASDPPNFGTNPAPFGNTRTFSKLAVLPAGTYLVGSDEAVLKKLTDVAAQLNASAISGDVIYELKSTYDGTTGETFPITINQVSTVGGNWTVTIRPGAGAGIRTTSGSSASAVIKLNGADRVTLDGRESGVGTTSAWTVSNTNTAAATAAVWLSSLGAAAGSMSNTVEYLTLSCGVDQSANSSETFGIVSCGSTIGASEGTDNDANSFVANRITKARWGIYLRGAFGNANDGDTVSRNVVGPSAFGPDEIGKSGIVLQNQNTATVNQNEVRFVGGPYALVSSGADRVGIGIGDHGWPPSPTVVTNSTVTRNFVHDIVEERTSSAVGIVVGGSGSPSSNTIANNMICNVLANGAGADEGAGIGIAAGNGDKVVYNSIRLAGDLDPSAPAASASNGEAGIIIDSAAPANLTLKDNIADVDLTSNTSALKHYAIIAPSASYAWGAGGSNNNDYHVNPANSQMVLGGIGTGGTYADVMTLTEWRSQFTPGQDGASHNVNPPFRSATDLRLATGSPTPLESGAVMIAGISDDFEGDIRFGHPGYVGAGIAPDVGADEGDYTPTLTEDIAATAFVDPANGGNKGIGVAFSPRASYTNNGPVAQTNVTVRYRIVGPSPLTDEIYSQTATIDSLVSLAATTVTFPSVTVAAAGIYTIYSRSELPDDQVPLNNEIAGSFSVSGALSGAYLVGTAGAYNTITAAVADLNARGLSGPVQFLLTDAIYPSETFPISIDANADASATNTLTIRPATGVTTTISGDASGGALIRLNGADYVTIDGSNSGGTDRSLTLTNSGPAAPCAILIASLGDGAGATHDLVKNCSINSAGTSGIAYGISISGAAIGSAGADNDNVTLQNNAIASSNIGLYADGNAAVSEGGMDSLTVTGNAFTISGSTAPVYGVEVSNMLHASASRNTFGLTTSAGTPPVAISLEANVSHSSVTGNRIEAGIAGAGGYGGRGIVVGTGMASSDITIANNFVAGVNGSNDGSFSTSSMGIGIGVVGNSGTLTSTTGGVKLIHNSVNMSGSYSSGTACLTAGLYVGSGASSLDIRNNIIVNALNNVNPSGSSSKNYVVYSTAASAAFLTISNNDYSASGTQGVLGFLGSDHTTLAEFNTAFTGSANTPGFNLSAPFITATDLHLPAATMTLLESGGAIGTGVMADIDDETRPGPPGSVNGGATAPDVGADEFDGRPAVANDIAAAAFVDPVDGGSKSIGVAFAPQASFTNNGMLSQSNVTVRYRIVGPAPLTDEVYNRTAVIASIAGLATTTVAFPSLTLFDGGAYTIFSTSELPGDQVPANNQITGSLSALGLSGTYLVGTSLFNQVTGANLTFERKVERVTREFLEPADSTPQMSGDKSNTDVVLADRIAWKTVTHEIEEVTWVPMSNGKKFEQPLRVSRSENPDLPQALKSGVYATITAAVADLNTRGASGPVQFLLTDASYPSETFPITVDVTGAAPNATNAVTIKPNTGVNATVSGTSSGGPLFKVFNTSYITIDGSNVPGGTTRDLTIENASATSPGVVWFGSNGATPITNGVLKNCIVRDGSSAGSAVVISDGTILGSPGAFSNMEVRNNKIEKAYIGVFANGGTTPAGGTNLTYSGNDLGTSGANSIRFCGLYMQGVDGAAVEGNTVANVDAATDENDVGIWLAIGTTNATVSGNAVSNLGYTGTSHFAPIGIDVTSGVAGSSVNITHNVVANVSTNGSTAVRGIASSAVGSAGVVIQRNDVHGIVNTSPSSFGAYGIEVTGGNNHVIKNNFVSDLRLNMTGGVAFSTTYGVFGIRIGSGTGHVVVNNSVDLFGSMTGTANSSLLSAALCLVSTNSTGCDIRDNILSNTLTGGTTFVAHVSAYLPSGGSSAMSLTWNNNAYYCGANTAQQGIAQVGTSAITGFYLAGNFSPGATTPSTNFRAYSSTLSEPGANDNASFVSTAAAPYMSDTDLHIRRDVLAAVSNAGSPIAGVTDDYDGETRSAMAPDMGADEFTNTRTITASAGPNGSIGPSGAVTVEYGADETFTITPGADYHVADVLVDNSSVGSVGSYTFHTVTSDHSISASFVLGVVSANGIPAVPRMTELLPPAPNPFQPRTTITYRMPTPGFAELLVFAADGSLVRMLVSGVREPGEHQEVWDGRDNRGALVSSGKYFVRLRTGGVTHVRAVTLLR